MEYKISVSNFVKNYHYTFNTLDQENICAEICQTATGFWSKELADNGIYQTDQKCFASCSSSAIHLLIGADVEGKLMTGNIIYTNFYTIEVLTRILDSIQVG